jgi:hypothetical protein
MAKNISIDRTKRLREEPHKGHNRWHPDIPRVIEVEPGEEVTLDTRDAMDLQIGPRTIRKRTTAREPISIAVPGFFLSRLLRACPWH